MARKTGLLATVKKVAKGTAAAAKAVDQVAKGDRCYACGALGPVRWVEGHGYGRKCGHASAMVRAGGTTVEKAVKRDGSARAAMPPEARHKSGGPITRGKHRASRHRPGGTY